MTRNDEEAGRKVGDFLGGVLDGLSKHWKNVALLAAVVAGGYGWMRPANYPETFSQTEMRALLRKEIQPLRAGIEELAKSQSLETQNRVLRAMMKVERANEEN